MVLIINKIKRNLEQSKYVAQRDGLLTACYCLFHDLITRITPFSAYKAMILTMSTLDPIYLKGPKNYRYLFLNREQMIKCAGDPNNDMSKNFIEEALSHSEECFAILDGEVLASYTWYSSMPSHARRELYFYSNKSYKYAHKFYTAPGYRGQRLLAIGVAKACKEYTERGFKGLLSIVEAHNLNSLRSVYRMGYRDIGKIYVIMIFGKYLSYANKGCKIYDCMLGPFELERT